MNYLSITIVLALVVFLIVSYFIEVVHGSQSGLFNAELGYNADSSNRTHLSNREFFFQYLPIMLGIAGLLFLLAHIE
jgi:hypothetical protein